MRSTADVPGSDRGRNYLTVFVTLGAATEADQPVEMTIEGYTFGLSKRSFQVA